MENNMQNPSGCSSQSPSRFDRLTFAMLVGVIVMLAISAMNLWTLNRFGERIGKIEVAMRGGRSPGPDPNRIHTVKTAGAQTKGPGNAPVTIVEFSDFQCPFCAKVLPTLKQIENTYRDRVRIVWKHLPLDIHKDAVGAAVAAEAAGKQGKFWEYHDKLFANRDRLAPDDLKQYANDLQLDMKRFEADRLDLSEKKKIDADLAEAQTLGINGTPAIFINGRHLAGAQPFEMFAKIIDEELAKRNLAVPSPSSSN
jgi:protein-disulfide isomerase